MNRSSRDLIAGLTVAAVSIPQGMAYARVAGVPIEMGLAAAAIPAVIAALVGSSPYLVTGPTNPIALVIGASVVAPAVAAGLGVPVADVLGVALLAGLLLIGFAAVRLGGASRFLSDSVICGLSVGVGILVVAGQIASMGGPVSLAPTDSALVPEIWPLLVGAWHALVLADVRTAVLLLGVPAVVILLRLVDPRWPGGMLALGVAALVSTLLGWNEGSAALPMLDAAVTGAPSFAIPALPDPARLGAPALAIALLVSAQSLGAARSMGASAGREADQDRDLLGQGAANLAASVVGAMPTSGSFSRTALARRAGASTRMAAAVSGVAVLALVPLIGGVLSFLPVAALAGLVVLTGLDLIRFSLIRRAAATRGDASVLIVTIGAALWLGILQAIYAGLFLSLALLVRRSGRLQMVEIVRAGSRLVREIPIDEETGTAPAVVLHLEGDLNFAVAPELVDQLRAIGSRGARVLIVRLKRARHLDATVLEGLRRVCSELVEDDITVILCGLTAEVAEKLRATELGALLGADGLLETGPRLFEGLERAFARARTLLAPLSDQQIFRSDEPDTWSYEI